MATSSRPSGPICRWMICSTTAFARSQPVLELLVEIGQNGVRVIVRSERDMRPQDPELVVGVQIVRRRQQGHDAGKALAPEPQDLLLPAHPAVVAGVAARALADGQPVFDDPGEESRGDPLGPLSPHALTRSWASRTASMVGPTSCTLSMAAPRVMAQTAEASDASSRSSTGVGGSAPPSAAAVNRPRKVLRLVPTRTGTPVSTI